MTVYFSPEGGVALREQ